MKRAKKPLLKELPRKLPEVDFGIFCESMNTLLVGLGNPGRSYEPTRHNVGWRALDALAERAGIVKFKSSFRFPCKVAEGDLAGHGVTLVKPTTFMNRSGQAVQGLFRKKGYRAENLILIYDETALDCGKIRIRLRGSSAGHNGVQSVIDSIGTNEFTRVRVGIGPRPKGDEMKDFVLSSFSPDESLLVRSAVDTVVDAIECLLSDGSSAAMTRFN